MSTPAPNTQTALAKQEKEMAFKPFANDEEIKLSIVIVRSTLATPTRTGKLPTDQECVRFMMLCKSRALNPFEGDAFLLGFEGSDGPKFDIITAHQAFLKRAEIHPDFDGMESGVLVRDKETGLVSESQGDFMFDNQELLGGWARVHHKGKKIPTYRRCKLQTYNKGFGRWKIDPAGMICKVAEADALRSAFPTKLGGLYLREEIELDPKEVKVASAPPVFDMPQLANGTKPVSAPRVDDPLPESEAPQEHPLETPQMPRPASEGKSPGEVIDSLSSLLRDNNLPEDALTAWVRASKRAKPNQHWNELADSKLRTILDEWETLLPMIKEVEV